MLWNAVTRPTTSVSGMLARLLGCLTDDDLAASQELVVGDLEVVWGGAFADAAGAVIVGSVAWAEPAAVVPCSGDGHAAQVGADTNNDEVLQGEVRTNTGAQHVFYAG